jgi:hypothetical protein
MSDKAEPRIEGEHGGERHVSSAHTDHTCNAVSRAVFRSAPSIRMGAPGIELGERPFTYLRNPSAR